MAGLRTSLPISSLIDRLGDGVRASQGPLVLRFVEVIAVIGLAWFCAQLIWSIFTPLPNQSTGPAVMSSRTADQQSINVTRLRGFPYFYPVGEQQRRSHTSAATGGTSASSANRPAAPETDLELKLFGLRAEIGSEDRGSAIIQTTDKRQAAFAPGQTIQQGVRLEQVFPDRVEIIRDGVRESLYLNPDRRSRPALVVAEQTARPAASASGFTPAQSVSEIAPQSSSVISTAELMEISPAEALAQFQLRPRLEGSRINGFIVQALGSDPRLDVLGVQPGDVIMDVNGTRLTSFERINELPEELRNATELRIGLLRDGKRQERRIGVSP